MKDRSDCQLLCITGEVVLHDGSSIDLGFELHLLLREESWEDMRPRDLYVVGREFREFRSDT